MKKRTLKIMAIAMVFALIFAFAAIPTSAANYTTEQYAQGGTTTFNKHLVVDSDTNIPNKTFSFSVASGNAMAATNNTVAVLAGPVVENNGEVTSPSIADVTFAPNNTTTNGLPSDAAGSSPTAGKKYATQTATVSFADITFPEPGVYRYTITEAAQTSPYSLSASSTNPLTLDVYVTNNNNGSLEVSEYVLHTGTAAPAANATSGTADVSHVGDALSDKTDNFTNEYSTKDLGISKRVSGNQASKDKYFEFTVTVPNMAATDTFDVDITGAVADPVRNDATNASFTSMSNPTSVTGAELDTGVKFYLQDGQFVKILGLPAGASYTVTENAEDYTSTPGNDIVAVAAQGGDPAKNYTDNANSTLDADKYVGFTNTRDGVIPTGVLLTVAPFAIGLLLFGALAVFFIARKKRREGEDEE